MKNIVEIKYSSKIVAIIIKSEFKTEGVSFFTPGDFSQQLGYMSHPKNKIIEPHVHNKNVRTVTLTQEVLFIKSGKIRVDFYTDTQTYIESKILSSGDVILLASGGHGFECLEPTEMIEVKQGPYSSEVDKTRFNAISKDDLIING